jgi:hypothetical protein
MIPKSCRLFGKDHAQTRSYDPEKACPGLDPGCAAVSAKIMLKQVAKA